MELINQTKVETKTRKSGQNLFEPKYTDTRNLLYHQAKRNLLKAMTYLPELKKTGQILMPKFLFKRRVFVII